MEFELCTSLGWESHVYVTILLQITIISIEYLSYILLLLVKVNSQYSFSQDIGTCAT